MNEIVNFAECATIINNIFNMFLKVRIYNNVQLSFLITIILIIGFLIHSLANKEP